MSIIDYEGLITQYTLTLLVMGYDEDLIERLNKLKEWERMGEEIEFLESICTKEETLLLE